jgi:hypothetical protein
MVAQSYRTYVEKVQLVGVCCTNASREEEQVPLLPRHLDGRELKSYTRSWFAHYRLVKYVLCIEALE